MGHDHLFLLVDANRASSILAMAVQAGIEPGYASGLLARLGSRAVADALTLTTDSSDDARMRAVSLLAEVGGPGPGLRSRR
jgi:hypothetical protein